MTPELFRKKVADALDDLPPEFQEKLENVEILVEDFPDQETLGSMGLQSKWDLLGLYVGVPLSEKSFFGSSVLPERIYLYRKPILRECRSPAEVTEAIKDVLIHEVGHHFGFDDDELEAMTGNDE